MSKHYMTVAELKAALDNYPNDAMVAVQGYKERWYANIRFELTVVPIDNDGYWDYELQSEKAGAEILLIEADNVY